MKVVASPAIDAGGADAELRILVVTAMYPRPGKEGYGAFVMQQVEELRAQGHEVEVLDFPGYRSKVEYIRAAATVFRKTRGRQYSVVHAHYGLTGMAAIFRNSVPLVLTVHGSDALAGWFQPLITKFVSKLADTTIVVSPAIAKRISGVTIPCGVDLSIFEPKSKEESRRLLNLTAGRKYVLFPFDPQRFVKRFDLASAAVAQLTSEGIDVEILKISKVHFREMPWYYSAADAMILCSDSEGSPTSVKEALACNLPVLSTDVGDVREIMQGVSGVEIVEQNVNSLAAGLKRILSPAEGFIFAGRKAMERYSQYKTVSEIVGVYRQTIARQSMKIGRRIK